MNSGIPHVNANTINFLYIQLKFAPLLIQQEEKDNQGSFFIEEDGIQLAEMDYSLSPPNTMVILHTEVDEVLKGRNIGNQLINHAVQYARIKNYKIIPLCPFVKSVFEKRPEEFKDVVKGKEVKE